MTDLVEPPPLNPQETPTVAHWAWLTRPFSEEDIEHKPQPVYPAERGEKPPRATCVQGAKVDTPFGSKPVSKDGYFCGNYHAHAIHLTYVGHAGLTTRLNEVCTPAGWDWAPVATDEHGLPVYTDGGLWIRLTIWGVPKLGFGDAQGKTGPNAIKEIIGDALRNAGMRFGLGTYLWGKSDRAKALAGVEDATPTQRQERPAPQQAPEVGPKPYEAAVARAIAASVKLEPMRALTTDAKQERLDTLAQVMIVNGFDDDVAGWNDLARMLEVELDARENNGRQDAATGAAAGPRGPRNDGDDDAYAPPV